MSIDVGTITNSNPNPQIDRRPLGGPPAAAPSRMNAIGLPVGGTAPPKVASAVPAAIGALVGGLGGGHAGGLKDAIEQARALGVGSAKPELARGIAAALAGTAGGALIGEGSRRAYEVLAPVGRIVADMAARKLEPVSPRETGEAK